MSHDFRYLDRTTIQKVSFLSGPKWVASIPGTRKTRSGRHFFWAPVFVLLQCALGGPKKRRGRGLDHSFATYALPQQKKKKCHHTLSLFRVCVLFVSGLFLFLRGGKECEWIASPFLSFLFLFCKGTVSKWGPIFLTLASRHSYPPFLGQCWAFFAWNDKKITNYLTNVWLQFNFLSVFLGKRVSYTKVFVSKPECCPVPS